MLEDVLKGEMDDTSAAAKLQGALFLKEIEGSPVPSHTKLLYPWCDKPIPHSLRAVTLTLRRVAG